MVSRRFVLTGALVFGLTLTVARGQQPANMPTGAELMDNYVKSTGGKDAYDKVKTYIVKGTFAFAGVKGDALIHGKAPNFMHFALNLQGIGNIEAGFDGKVFWENNPITGPKITDSNQNKDLMPGLDFSSDANWREQYKSAKNEGVEKIDGKEAYRVELVDKKGEKEQRYFDKATGHVVKMKKAMKSELGNLQVEMNVGEYKKVGDLTIPHHVTANMLGQKIEVQLNDIKLNAPVPDSKFDLPEPVKELLKKKKDQSK
jgi:hypothetical protein